MKILTRSLLGEYLHYLGFGLGLFCLALVGGDMFLGGGRVLLEAHATDRLLAYALCRLPQACGFALPMSCLLATLLTVGRMSSSNELIAIRCGGVSTARALAPLMVLTALFSLGLMLANLSLVPRSVLQADRIIEAGLASGAVPTGFSLPPRILPNGDEVVLSALTYRSEGQSIEGLSLALFRESRRIREVYVEDASWTGDSWRLKGISIRDFGVRESSWKAGLLLTRTLVGLDLPTPGEMERQRERPDEMSARQLLERARSAPKDQARSLWLRLSQRLAIPWACLLFTLFSSPIAVVPHRSGMSAGFGGSLALSGLYYLVATLASLLCSSHLLSPGLAAWAPNLFFGTAALYLWRMRRDIL